MSFTATSLRMLAGPIVWALHFIAIYGFNAMACIRGFPGMVAEAVALASIAAATLCLLLIVREWRHWQGFVSWIAAGLAGFALLAIAWEAAPVLVVAPCA